MKTWMTERPLPTAVFVANDAAAVGAMAALNEGGIRIPEDVAIVGAGNIHYGDMLRVPLTTVSWSTAAMGNIAAGLLLELIENQKGSKQNQRIVVDPELLVRQSCGATRANVFH